MYFIGDDTNPAVVVKSFYTPKFCLSKNLIQFEMQTKSELDQGNLLIIKSKGCSTKQIFSFDIVLISSCVVVLHCS